MLRRVRALALSRPAGPVLPGQLAHVEQCRLVRQHESAHRKQQAQVGAEIFIDPNGARQASLSPLARENCANTRLDIIFIMPARRCSICISGLRAAQTHLCVWPPVTSSSRLDRAWPDTPTLGVHPFGRRAKARKGHLALATVAVAVALRATGTPHTSRTARPVGLRPGGSAPRLPQEAPLARAPSGPLARFRSSARQVGGGRAPRCLARRP